MPIALNIFCFAVPFTMLFVAVLSVAAGVGGCEWPIYDREVCMDVAFWKFSNNPPNSDSVANAITFLIMLNYICNDPFSGHIYCTGVLYFGTRKKYPPALLSASSSDMYDAYEYIQRIITLLLYSVTASGCDALSFKN